MVLMEPINTPSLALAASVADSGRGNRVAGEEGAEDQYLCRQKQPHAHPFGLVLLLEVLEVVGQDGVVSRHHRSPSGNTRKARS